MSVIANCAVLFLFHCALVNSIHLSTLRKDQTKSIAFVEESQRESLSSSIKLDKGQCIAFQVPGENANCVFAANVDGEHTWVYKLEPASAAIREYFFHKFAVLNKFVDLQFDLLLKGEDGFDPLLDTLKDCVKHTTVPQSLVNAVVDAKVLLKMEYLNPIRTLRKSGINNFLLSDYFNSIGAYAAFETVTTASDKFPYPKASDTINVGYDSGKVTTGLQNSFIDDKGNVLPLDIDTMNYAAQVHNPTVYCAQLFNAYKKRIAQTVCNPKKSPYGTMLEDYLTSNDLLKVSSPANRLTFVGAAREQFEKISEIHPTDIDAIVTTAKKNHPTFDAVVTLDNVMMGDHPPGPDYLKCWIDSLKDHIIFDLKDKRKMCMGDNCCTK